LAICTSMPLRSSHDWTSASVAFASSTSSGTLSRNADTWSASGLASSTPTPVTKQTMHSITIKTATPRGTPARRSTITSGFSSSAMSAPMMNSRITGPAARRITYRPTTASGSATSCTHRGTTRRVSCGALTD
jgi:hypothetical protein